MNEKGLSFGEVDDYPNRAFHLLRRSKRDVWDPEENWFQFDTRRQVKICISVLSTVHDIPNVMHKHPPGANNYL